METRPTMRDQAHAFLPREIYIFGILAVVLVSLAGAYNASLSCLSINQLVWVPLVLYFYSGGSALRQNRQRLFHECERHNLFCINECRNGINESISESM